MKAAKSKTPTRERLIEAARLLFWERGYEAASMADILERARANSGSFYHFFKSKEDLLLAVLEKYRLLLHPAVMDPAFARAPDPIERIFAVLEGYRQSLAATGFAYGCPIGRLAVEIGTKHGKVHALISANFDGWKQAIRGCVEEAQAAGRLAASLDAARLATFVLTVMEGAVMQARSARSVEPFDDSVAQLRDYVRRLEAAGRDPRSAAHSAEEAS
jgi:TetR/AcrR family transcriptional repressor of nem operon